MTLMGLGISANAVALILIGYAATLVLLAVLTQPLRLRMVTLSNAMLRDKRLTVEQRLRLNFLVDTCMSFRVGLLLPVAATVSILRMVLGDEPKLETGGRLFNDTRYHSLVLCYFVSILAANPLAALVSVPLLCVGFLIAWLSNKANAKAAVEEATLMASASLAQGRVFA
jgi:hypothetical protein